LLVVVGLIIALAGTSIFFVFMEEKVALAVGEDAYCMGSRQDPVLSSEAQSGMTDAAGI
jgi:hypothetical protein